ncbi:hypothetical protein JTE90_029620 [Oedothorax gibbosus]|uniref:Elongation of very long chain fatty acids protein n=1 Tax=Oedothorax gibbosus TaxID=931172 RepID=A0AAV6VEI6_9ARAC|nr:hypothetical protein JTE90_029620 [Oedothorax gibbosus]
MQLFVNNANTRSLLHDFLDPKQRPMALLESVIGFFADRNVEDKYLIKEYKVIYSILVFYILFVKWIGPALMKNYKSMDLRYTIRVYNFGQVIFNAIILIQLVTFGARIWPHRCQILYNPNYPVFFRDASRIIWHIFLIKLSDLLDTVFFVLRKKNRQITILHVFHHAGMVLLFHTGISTINIGYYILVCICINTFIHSIMYFYYFLAAFGPEMQKYLWWKRYLTQMQIFQFIVVLVYMTWAFITGCEQMAPFELSIYIFTLLILLLFVNFYFKSFRK